MNKENENCITLCATTKLIVLKYAKVFDRDIPKRAVLKVTFLTASIVITSGLRNYFVVVLVVGSNAKCDVIRRIVVAKCNRT